MPSGPKKRKAQKKPNPGEPPTSQGEPPELEPGLEESMAKDGEDMVEGSPSPKATDGASETMAEMGGADEGEGLAGGASREENEVAEVEEALSAPDHPEVGTRDPPELVSEVPTIYKSEAGGENEVAADIPDISQGDLPAQVEEEKHIPPGETAPGSEALPRESIPGEAFAEPNELGSVEGGAGASPIDIAPHADKDEPTEAVKNEISQEAHLGSDPGLDESAVELERIADTAQEDIGLEDDTTPDGVATGGIDPWVDETPPRDTQPEINEDSVADTDTAPANVEPEGTDVAPVATAAETNEGPASIQLEVDESVVEAQRENDAAAEILDMDPGMGEAPVDAQDPAQEGVNADAPSASIEPEVNGDVAHDTEAETDKGQPDVQSEMEEAADQRVLETDAVPINLEAESELEQEASQGGVDVPIYEIGQEVESVAPKIESQTEASEGEIEASSHVTSGAVEPEPEMTLREPEGDAPLDDIEKEEVAEAENKSEVNAKPIDTEQDEGTPVVPITELEDSASREVEPEVGVEDMHTSLEAEADALNEIESEPERPGDTPQEIEVVTESLSQKLEEVKEKAEPGIEALSETKEASDFREDPNEGLEASVEVDTEPKEVTSHEVELVDDTVPANQALAEASEVCDSKEEVIQEVETPADTELNGEAEAEVPQLEPEVEVPEREPESKVPESEPEVGVPSESKPEQESSHETESGQQGLFEAEPDQPYIQDQDQQTQQLERETDSGVEGPELPASEANPEDSLAVSDMSDAGLVEFSAPSATEGESSAIADSSVPANEQLMPEEGGVVSPPEEVVSPPEEGLEDGADAADTEAVLESEEGAVDEQMDEPEESINQPESTGADDVMDQEQAPSGEVDMSAVPSEQGSEIEQHPTIAVDEEVALGEEPPAAEIESSLDKQDLTVDSRTMDVPPGESEMIEQGLSTTLPSESEATLNEDEPKDGVTSEREQNPDSLSGDMERDIGEEEAASSTVAEAGSVANDFDESASYQQLPTDFPSSGQDAEISESKEADDTLSRTPQVIVSGSTEEIDSEGGELDEPLSPTAPELIGGGLTKQVGGEHADSFGDDSKVSSESTRNSPDDKVEWKAIQDSEPTADHEALSLESAKVKDPAPTILESHTELPVDVLLSEESNVPEEEINVVEAVGGDGGTAAPNFGIVPALDSLAVSKEELMSKLLPSETNGLRTLPSSEASMPDLSPSVEGGSDQNSAVVNSVKPEIYTAEAKGKVFKNTSNGSPLQSASPGQDIEDVQIFSLQKTREASLPVVVPAEDVKQRALEQGNLKGNKGIEQPSKGGTLQRRTSLLGCCGLFDVLLGKNK